MLSILPWGDLCRAFSSPMWQTWTELDDLRVAELEFEEAKKHVVANSDIALQEELHVVHVCKARRFNAATETVRQLDRLSVYNDKQLWMAFKFVKTHKHRVLIQVAPQLEPLQAARLKRISNEFFGETLPSMPDPDTFDDTNVYLNVKDIDWDYYNNHG